MALRRPATPTRARTGGLEREPQPAYHGHPARWHAALTPERDSPLLLDTHVWPWTIDGTAGTLGAAARGIIARAAARRSLFVRDFSFSEVARLVARQVARLVAKGRLEFAAEVGTWLERAALAPGIDVMPVSRSVPVQSTRLAGEPHGDPADCILLAQAQALGASLMTWNRGIVACAKRTPGLPVCDARG
jgi:PIN domain nuclease of toxin-antitoxin system